ncbi:MAG: ribosome biogenesis factor YjgA [Pseudomonadales bacterium]
MPDTPEQFDDFPEEKSKSQLKREVEALQELGKRLTGLNDEQLGQVPMPDTLERAIREYKRLKKGEALRRQLQYIGRLMRSLEETEIEAIDQTIKRFDASQVEHAQRFHLLENWRDRLLNDKDALTDYLGQHPLADAQHLRQLIRNAQKEQAQQKNLGSVRKLFRYLRDIAESDD